MAAATKYLHSIATTLTLEEPAAKFANQPNARQRGGAAGDSGSAEVRRIRDEGFGSAANWAESAILGRRYSIPINNQK